MPQFTVTKVEDDEDGEVGEGGDKRVAMGQIWKPSDTAVSGERLKLEVFPTPR